MSRVRWGWAVLWVGLLGGCLEFDERLASCIDAGLCVSADPAAPDGGGRKDAGESIPDAGGSQDGGQSLSDAGDLPDGGGALDAGGGALDAGGGALDAGGGALDAGGGALDAGGGALDAGGGALDAGGGALDAGAACVNFLSPPTSLPVVGSAYSAVIGNLANDGGPAIAVTTGQPGDAGLMIIMTDGGMDYSLSFSNTDSAQTVAAGDFNADGTTDLYLGFNTLDPVVLLKALSGGWSQAGTPFSSSYWDLHRNHRSAVVGDFKGNGGQTVTVLTGGSPNVWLLSYDPSISTLRTAGNATVSGSSLISSAEGVFGGDGGLQLAILDQNQSGLMIVSPHIAGGAPTTLVSDSAQAVAAGDFDGNGRDDIVTSHPNRNPDNRLSLWLNGSTSPTSFGVDVRPSALAAADLDGDGDSELLVTEYGALKLYGFRGGSLQLLEDGTIPPGGHTVTTGDLNRDGKPDVVITNSQSGATNSIIYLLNTCP